jgi:hypothetical protein
MAVMISGGILVRASGVLSSPVLGTFSIGMGTPLVLSSLRFAAAGVFPAIAAGSSSGEPAG